MAQDWKYSLVRPWQRTAAASRAFFDRPACEKQTAAPRGRTPMPRGYIGVARESYAFLVGETRPNDLVEKFRMGPPGWTSSPRTAAEEQLLCPNCWPSDTDTCSASAAGFRDAMREAFDATERVAQALLRALERVLHTDEPLLDLAPQRQALHRGVHLRSQRGGRSSCGDGGGGGCGG